MVAATEIVHLNLEERRAKDGRPGWKRWKAAKPLPVDKT